MRFLGLALAFLLLGVSCSRQATPPPICCSFPEFSVFLHAGVEPQESITISQVGEFVNISRNKDSRQVKFDRSYRALRALLFESEKWNQEAGEDFYQEDWKGKSRTVLQLEHKENGVSLLGDEVPAEWIAAIRDYADRKLGK